MTHKTEAQIKKALKQILKDIDVLKAQARDRGCEFKSLSVEQLTRKIRGETSNSPFFTAWAYDQLTNSGSPSFFLANYFNPDPRLRICIVTLFFGVPLEPEVMSAIAARDTRWAYVSTEPVFLNEGETGVANFTYLVPYVTKGTYFGNVVLWEDPLTGPVGTVFDRAILQVTTK